MKRATWKHRSRPRVRHNKRPEDVRRRLLAVQAQYDLLELERQEADAAQDYLDHRDDYDWLDDDYPWWPEDEDPWPMPQYEEDYDDMGPWCGYDDTYPWDDHYLNYVD